ncbi:restriction endonuclease subunit S [uncultured Brachyspira sp.]|uniref:restriction endonuclease subunit S n=1 Tax=uncultured Brachyspira sp. TaxID=221953 RepID=UPI00259B9C6E|nr:restriction endonuclease subunit S [uncultured Brachyspira sp.]
MSKDLKLNSIQWADFTLSQVFPFIMRGKRLIERNRKKGNIPYYSASKENNGLTDIIENPLFIEKDKLIISTFCNCFFVEGEFTASDEITIFGNDKLNKYNGLFISHVVKRNAIKYAFGFKAFSERLARQIVKLPINSKGQPNWEFMENYMRKIEEKQKQKAIKYYSDKIKNLQNSLIKNKFDLNNIEWKEFKISNFFEVSGTITTHPTKLKPNGKTPRITCASTNNGLDTTYDNEPTEKGKILTVDSATIGYVAYQENDFIATDHVEKIMFKNGKSMNRYLGLFIKQCIDNSVLSKYGYGYKFSQNRIKKQIIKLPVNSKGQPNWEFMENFMRKIEYKKLNIYLDYIKNKTATN